MDMLGVSIKGNYAYISDGSSGLAVIPIFNTITNLSGDIATLTLGESEVLVIL